MDPRAHDILAFWFSDKVVAEGLWFKGTPDFDREIADRFAADTVKAAEGVYDDWLTDAQSALALVIALDQFPRNLYRGSARAFASDAKAQDAAATAVERGFDRQVPRDRRLFFYMPFQHAEDMALQARSVALIKALNMPEIDYYADRHAELIRAFGRFPHRNALLGRESTPAEREYLARQPNEFG